MKTFTTLIAIHLAVSTPVSSKVLISQYYEGSGFNKWIELVNTDPTPVSLDGYFLTVWSNANAEAYKVDGGTPSGTVDLSGFNIPPNGHFLAGHPDANTPAYAIPDLTSSALNFNGNDSVVLYRTLIGGPDVGDLAGIEDALPMTNAGNEGRDISIVRQSGNDTVDLGLQAGASFRDASAIWDTLALPLVDNAFGQDGKRLAWIAHEFDLTLTLSEVSVPESAGIGAVAVTVTRAGPTDQPLDLIFRSSDETEAVIGRTFGFQIPAGQDTKIFVSTIDAVDDALDDGDQTVQIEVCGGGINPGYADLVVTDDDDFQSAWINEVFTTAGPTDDTNNDGIFAFLGDGFVEILNISGAALDISGWEFHTDGGMFHTVSDGTFLSSGGSLVLFFGGSADYISGSSLYRVANGFFSPNFGGDTITLKNGETGLTEAEFPIGDIAIPPPVSGESQTFEPDGPTGNPVIHGDTAGGAPYSPGQTVDGTDHIPPLGGIAVSADATRMSELGGQITVTYTRNGDLSEPLKVRGAFDRSGIAEFFDENDRCLTIPAGQSSASLVITAIDNDFPTGTQSFKLHATADRYDSGEIELMVVDEGDVKTISIALNEIHSDPASGLPGDANGDGIRSSTQDEFLEFVNPASAADLSGFSICDASRERHVFPPGTVLQAGQALVLFGGGTPTGNFGGAVVMTASSGQLGLTNTGDTIILKAPGGFECTRWTYDGTIQNQGMTQSPDLSGSDWVAHPVAEGSGGALFSPGTKVDGTNFESGIKLIDCHIDPLTRLVVLKVRGIVPGELYHIESAPFLSSALTGIEEWRTIIFHTARAFSEVEGEPGVFSLHVFDLSINEHLGQLYRIVPRIDPQ